MTAVKVVRVFIFLIAVLSMSLMVGCSFMGMEMGSKDRTGYDFYHKPLPEADRALNEARAAGKDRQCPAEFDAAKNMVDKSYEIYMACHTEEAIAMAQQAIVKINALCSGNRAKAPALAQNKEIINIEFETGSAEIKSKYHGEIKRFADVMKQNPEWNIVIDGHTDEVGGAEANRILSEKRANSVRDYLIKNFDIDASRIKAKGYGMSKPIASNKTNAGKQKNRRVEAGIDK